MMRWPSFCALVCQEFPHIEASSLKCVNLPEVVLPHFNKKYQSFFSSKKYFLSPIFTFSSRQLSTKKCDNIGINWYEFVRTPVFKKCPNSIHHQRLLPIMLFFYGIPFESSLKASSLYEMFVNILSLRASTK